MRIKKFIKDASIIVLGLVTLFSGLLTLAAQTPDDDYHHCESGQEEWSVFQCGIAFAISLLLFVLIFIKQKINLKKLISLILWIAAIAVFLLALLLFYIGINASCDGSKSIRDSFVVAYRQPVNGYMVKAVARSAGDIISADLTFTKEGQSFKLYTRCFGDTVFCKGRMDNDLDNPKLLKRYKNKTIEADYHLYRVKGCQLPKYTPFFFMDLDFDGIEELVIVHRSMGYKYRDDYDVYRIVEGSPVLISYPPYNDSKDHWGFDMADNPEFDYKKKTISCPYPEGVVTWTGRTIYGISKTQKDTVMVNGKMHLFNHMEVIKEEKYSHDE